uniref:Lysozyme n=1 Tax=Anopheles epiroticus TaxID=199890 RepID=A0A182PRC9_9DIPT
MKVFSIAALTIVVACSVVIEAKKFGKCELAKALANNGIAKASLPDWICLVQNESAFSTSATNKNKNGSTDYGIFQINNKYWCDSGYGSNDCKIACSSLLNDDITDDIKCAKLIHKRHGFNAWYGWKNHCNGKTLPSVRICLVENESRYDSTALNAKNKDGSTDYGIFQINNRYWCAEGKVGPNECKLQCRSLRDDNIIDDIRCAKFIYARHRFNAWVAWRNKCNGKTKPILLAVVVSCSVSEAKTFTKCELVKALYSRGIPKKSLPDWVCLVQWESSFRTTATHVNDDGSTDYGIFQINNQYWCDSSYGSNACRYLLTDDISDDIKCAKLIYSQHRFEAWYGWVQHCKGQSLPDVSECF